MNYIHTTVIFFKSSLVESHVSSSVFNPKLMSGVNQVIITQFGLFAFLDVGRILALLSLFGISLTPQFN